MRYPDSVEGTLMKGQLTQDMADKFRKDLKGDSDKWQALYGAQAKDTLTWGDVDPMKLKQAVAAATEDGAALLLARTSDAGALLIQVFTQKGKPKLYSSSVSELHEKLELISKICNV